MHRALLVSSLIVALLAGTGCGPLSKRAYVKRADGICRQMKAKERGLAAADALHDVGDYARRGKAVVAYDQRAREQLGKLRAPNELKDRVRAYLVALDRRLELQRKAVDAAKRGDVAAVLQMELTPGIRNERQAAERAGFKVCGHG